GPRHVGPERGVRGQIREALRGARRGRARGGAAVRGRGARGAVSRAGAFVPEMTRRHRDLSRREAIALLGAAALTPLVRPGRRGFAPHSSGPGFRIRTITVGTNLRSPSDPRSEERRVRKARSTET